MPASDERFGTRIVRWQRRQGRHELPWQNTRDPFRIWVAEIMLQQTQVTTVLQYFERFMARFPDVAALARADVDAVLQCWSGLGYYSRARNLHRAATIVIDHHGGTFPCTAAGLAELPGVGRSTAAAIAAAAFGERRAILDGNVKRVLTRYFAIEGDPATTTIERTLWALAESLVPTRNVATYTQGMMDLGATVCTRRSARCECCPLAAHCIAYREGRVDELPAPRLRKRLPERATSMLVLCHRGEVLLEKRPPVGIWGGLWCFPELIEGEALATLCRRRFGLRRMSVTELPLLRHGFTHFKLAIRPLRVDVVSRTMQAGEPGQMWLSLADARGAAIPAPVRRILEAL